MALIWLGLTSIPWWHLNEISRTLHQKSIWRRLNEVYASLIPEKLRWDSSNVQILPYFSPPYHRCKPLHFCPTSFQTSSSPFFGMWNSRSSSLRALLSNGSFLLGWGKLFSPNLIMPKGFGGILEKHLGSSFLGGQMLHQLASRSLEQGMDLWDNSYWGL